MEGNRVKRRFVGGEIYLVTECLYSAKNDDVKGEADIQDGDKYLAEFVPWGAKWWRSPALTWVQGMKSVEAGDMNTIQNHRWIGYYGRQRLSLFLPAQWRSHSQKKMKWPCVTVLIKMRKCKMTVSWQEREGREEGRGSRKKLGSYRTLSYHWGCTWSEVSRTWNGTIHQVSFLSVQLLKNG